MSYKGKSVLCYQHRTANIYSVTVVLWNKNVISTLYKIQRIWNYQFPG